MSGFVIQYNRRSRMVIVDEFPGENGYRDAFQRRLELESARQDSDIEIASLNSESLETIRRTHSRYFDGTEQLSA